MDFFRFLDTTTDKNGTNLLLRLSINYTHKTGVHDSSIILSRYLPVKARLVRASCISLYEK
ncbi:hypothetical protein BVF97_13395 [Bacillus thuringiensis]|uniref:Uncharacterized protein n=1 Tax=Bacillus thuringiensis TaxID=1428 RepID=A0ABD6R9M4_BACTU|nr:hypothetical protein BVF97_13395 [Bacillus thuringiensis]